MFAVPPAVTQPSGTQYFETTTTGQSSYVNTGALVMTTQFGPTKFQVVNGNGLEQAGTSKCLTYNIQAGSWYVTSPCNSRVTQQFDYKTFATGAESIIAVYNGECMTGQGGTPTEAVFAETCDTSNVNQRFRWHG